jgi:hypothetical protein
MPIEPCRAFEWYCILRSYTPDPLLFLATASLGAITWRLVVRTNDLARDSLLATTLADRAHQEQLMPICHFVGTISMVFVGRDRTGAEIIVEHPERMTEDGVQHIRTMYTLHGKIRNAGPGAALNIQLNFGIARREGSLVWAVEPLGTLAANGEVELDRSYNVWPQTPPNEILNGWIFQILAHNVFQQIATTGHAGGFWNSHVINVDRSSFAFEPPKNVDRYPSQRTEKSRRFLPFAVVQLKKFFSYKNQRE